MKQNKKKLTAKIGRIKTWKKPVQKQLSFSWYFLATAATS